MNKTILAVVLALFTACANKPTMTPEQRAAYEEEINAWHEKRMENIKAPDGWLNLVALLWLEPGVNTFGSDERKNIVFPKGSIAPDAGYFLVTSKQVSIKAQKGVSIKANGQPIRDQVIFYTDSTKPVVLTSGSLVWNIIKRDDKLGIRLRDLESDDVKQFQGVSRYPVDPEYKVEATFEPSDSSHTIQITNAIGQTTAQTSPGTLKFELLGKEQHLDVLRGNENEYFVIFADSTSGRSTYDGGRYLYVKKPQANEKVVIDFNKAYNPPCVFTPYATCPLPPQQNYLSVAVAAGELNYRHPSSVSDTSP